MTNAATQELANIIVAQAFEFMATKAQVTVEEIKTYIMSSEIGMKRFLELVKFGTEHFESKTWGEILAA